MFLLGQSIQDHLVSARAISKLGIDPGDGGAADGNLASDHLVSAAIVQQAGNLKALGEGGYLLNCEQVTEKSVALLGILQ